MPGYSDLLVLSNISDIRPIFLFGTIQTTSPTIPVLNPSQNPVNTPSNSKFLQFFQNGLTRSYATHLNMYLLEETRPTSSIRDSTYSMY